MAVSLVRGQVWKLEHQLGANLIMGMRNDGGGTRAVVVKWVKKKPKQSVSTYIVKVEPP